MLEGTGYTTRLKKERLLKIKEHFAKIRPRYAEFESKFIGVETEIFDSQIPGGMISNMESQLRLLSSRAGVGEDVRSSQRTKGCRDTASVGAQVHRLA